MSALRACVAVALLLGCEHEPRVTRVTLDLPQAIGCRPTEVEQIELRALGDFPTRDRDVLVFAPEDGLFSIDRFESATRALTIEGRGVIGRERWVGGGVAFVGDRSEALIVPLLRYGRACPLADASARALDGVATAALPDGRLMLAGGHEGSRVRAGITVVHPAWPLASESEARLFVDRTDATLTYLDGVVVLAGGSASVDGPGVDTFEVIRVGERDERAGEGFLHVRRRDHAAVAIGPGRVLIAGGRSEADGPPIAELEVIDARGMGTASIVGTMAVARAGLSALRMDDGTIALVGGEGGVGAIERFDPRTGELVLGPGAFSARAGAAHAALAGNRVVQIGGREGDAWTGEVELALPDGQVLALGPLLDPLEAPRAAPLSDGRVVVIGRDPMTRRARGAVLDPGSAEVASIEASRAATLLVVLADGSLMEGDAEGLSSLRLDVRTPFDSLPASLAPALMEDRARLALDAPGRWRASGGTLIADADGARFDVPGLRFASFALELEAEGALEVLLVRDEAPPLALALAQDAVVIDACRVPRVEGGPLRVRRQGDTLTVDAGAGAVSCSAELPTRVGVAIRAARGAGVRRVAIARE